MQAATIKHQDETVDFIDISHSGPAIVVDKKVTIITSVL